MSAESRLARRAPLLVGLLLLLHLAVLLDTARHNSETFDEPMYLLAGRSYWATGDFSLNREHPPLLKLLIGLPLHLEGLALPAAYQSDAATQLRFVYELNDDPLRTVFLGRLPMIALGLLLGLYVYLFARLFGDERCGLLALLAYQFQPGVIGNTPLAALDLGAAAFTFIALYHFARLRMQPAAGRTLLAGVTFGLAQLTKFSALLLGPVYVACALVDSFRERSWRPLARLAGLFLAGATTMFLGYGCEMRTLDSVAGHPRYASVDPRHEVFDSAPLRALAASFGDRPVPLLTYWKGLDYVRAKSVDDAHASWFRGEGSRERNLRLTGGVEPEDPVGWKSFYLVTLAVKTPVMLLVGAAFALLCWPFLPRGRGAELPLLLLPLLTLVQFSLAASQLGLRYVLPVLPALAVLVGRIATLDAGRHRPAVGAAAVAAFVGLPVALFLAFPERGPAGLLQYAAVAVPAAAGLGFVALLRWPAPDPLLRRAARLLALFCVVAGGAEALARHPDHLMFFNAFAGGPDRGYRITSVGDDWGQGVKALAEMQRERGWPEIRYDHYGTGVPEAHGLRYRPMGSQPVTGIVAVHAVDLTRNAFAYRWLDGLEPIARANSILVFEVTGADLAAFEARERSR